MEREVMPVLQQIIRQFTEHFKEVNNNG
jgi:hypothetical protein